jgi:uncharacterized protein YlxW (UPF0749 family)
VNTPVARLSVAAVAALLGFLVVVQLQSQAAGSTLATRSAQELTVIVANLNERNDQLRQEIATRQADLRGLQSTKARGESSLDELGRDLQRLRAWAGIDAVTGPGIRVTITGGLDGLAVMDLVNELRNAGAEALAIDGVRIVAASVVAGPKDGLSIEDHPIPDSFVIEAIGSPENLTGSLTRVGGIQSQLAATDPGTTVTITPVERLVLQATHRDLKPAHATPRL